MINRRSFIAAAASGLLLPDGVMAEDTLPVTTIETASAPYPIGKTPPPIWDLWLVRKETQQEYKATYVEDGQLNVQGYTKVCEALRDIHAPKSQQVVQIDIKLMNLLFATQQWMKIHNQYRPLIIKSGYRTIERNAKIENAARNSMHVHGKAADFTIDGLPTKYLGDFVKWFKEGGVGLYVSDDFVHIDTDRVRYWNGHGPKKAKV